MKTKYKSQKTSKLIAEHLPCWECNSSDAFAVYDDCHGHCFSCNFTPQSTVLLDNLSKMWYASLSNLQREKLQKVIDGITNGNTLDTLSMTVGNKNIYTKGNTLTESNTVAVGDLNPNSNDNSKATYQFLSFRGINAETRRLYNSKIKVIEDKLISVAYPYGDKGAKIRSIEKKDFAWVGTAKDALPLFGMDRFSPGQSGTIIITEGEEDAMAAYQMLQCKFPAVSVKGAATAKRDVGEAFDYVNSFDKIYICFDNDMPGQNAAKDVVALFNVNKVHNVQLKRFKDANEYLESRASSEFSTTVWTTKRYKPSNIVSNFDEFKAALSKETSPIAGEYPFPTLNGMTYGFREGELILIKALEKIGKTEFIRAIEYNLLKTTNENIGIMHLEEDQRRSLQGFVGYELERPVHLPDANVSVDDQMSVLRTLIGRDDRVFFYNHFGSDDPDVILDTIRYMATVDNCKFIFLDHITMVVTGHKDDGDERRKLDYISTQLKMMTKEFRFTLFLISHVNDDGLTRGSRNISKVADTIISLSRDPKAALLEERNKTYITVEGNRFASASGPASALFFDPKTFKLAEVQLPEEVIYDPGF